MFVVWVLYFGVSVLIFDDVFSGLDSDIDVEFFRCVFGIEGLFKKRGVIFIVCIYFIGYFFEVDYIVVFGVDGIVVE